jgi:Transition state regulatory protein AbrB
LFEARLFLSRHLEIGLCRPGIAEDRSRRIVLIALCGVLAGLLHLVAGTDALTAYLATSPGGADSVRSSRPRARSTCRS